MTQKTPDLSKTPDHSVAPRVAPLAESELSEDMRELLALPLGEHRKEAEPLSDFLTTLVRHPGLYRRYAPFAGKLLVGGKLPARHRELAILRNAWLCQAAFEWGEHVPIAKQSGVSAEEIERITLGAAAPGWEAFDRAILAAVEELHQSGVIGDDTWSVLAQRYDDKQLIELPMLIGAYQMIAYVQNALRIRLREGNAGLAQR